LNLFSHFTLNKKKKKERENNEHFVWGEENEKLRAAFK
jgi:hypothetical protein